MCVTTTISFFRFILKGGGIANLFTSLPSRSKQRKSLPGICRPGLCPHRPVPHERRPTRRRRALSRAVRHAPPTNARAHALALSPLPPAKRPRAPPLPFPLALALTAAAAPVPASREGGLRQWPRSRRVQ